MASAVCDDPIDPSHKAACDYEAQIKTNAIYAEMVNQHDLLPNRIQAEKIERFRAQHADALYDSICDPFALAILIAQAKANIVIASGNSGGSEPAYPAAASDFADVLKVIGTDVTRAEAIRMVLDDLLVGTYCAPYRKRLHKRLDALLVELSGTVDVEAALGNDATAVQVDPFAGTGILVAGATSYHGNDITDANPTLYTQTGPGLTVLVSSDGDFEPPNGCGEYRPDILGGNHPVVTADILGPGGLAADHGSYFSGDNEFFAFGGTSAAAAQLAGVCAMLWSSMPDETPATIRTKIIEQSADATYSNSRGYGMLRITS